MGTPKVSILVRTYNRERFIGETIESILGQSYQNFEILVVDDGSTDGTEALIKLVHDERIRYHYQPNQGQTSAMNTGVRMAIGEYLAILDSDDLWLPEILRTALEHLESDPSAGMFYGRASSIDEFGNPLAPILGCPLKYRDEPMKSLLYGDCVSPATIVIRRSCFDRIGLFDEELNGSEDWEMWIRIARYYKLIFYPQEVAKYRFHKANYTGTPANFRGIISARVRVLDKVFSDPTLPEEALSIRTLAYRNVYVDVGLRAFTVRDWDDALHYFSRAVRISSDPAFTVMRIVYLFMFHRVISKTTWTSRAITWAVALRR